MTATPEKIAAALRELCRYPADVAADLMLSQAARIAELEELAYCQTDKGPMLWKDIWQGEVDSQEWYRSSLNPIWRQVRLSERALALEEAIQAIKESAGGDFVMTGPAGILSRAVAAVRALNKGASE